MPSRERDRDESVRPLLRPAGDLRQSERGAAESAISFVDDVLSRYEPREAEEFIRALHGQVVELWHELEEQRAGDEAVSAADESANGIRDELPEVAAASLSAQERTEILRRLLTRRFERRRELMSESLTAPQVAEILGVSRQAPHDRRKAGRLLAVPVDNVWLFPAWQFDPAAPNSVLTGLPEVLAALNHLSPLQQYAWLRRPHKTLDGRSPIEVLRGGDVQRIVTSARGAGVA
jgi:hypothetical protein